MVEGDHPTLQLKEVDNANDAFDDGTCDIFIIDYPGKFSMAT